MHMISYRHMTVEMDVDENTPLVRGSQEDENEESLEGCGGTICCNPRRSVHRYLVLIIMCFLSFGSYFCYDNPAALQDVMMKELQINTGEFMNFYAWYSWPNVILCFFGGFLIDRVFGIRLGAIIFSLFVTGGQAVFATGALLKNVVLMDIGRFIFGIGGESLCVAQNTYAVSWFKGRELNMVFGLQLSFSRVGSTVNMNVMHPLYDSINKIIPEGYQALGVALFIAGAFCIFSLLCAFAMAFFDKRSARILKKGDIKTGDKIRLRDVKDFSLSMWLLCVICVAYYVTIFPFIGLGKVFFMMKFDFSPSQASVVNSIVYILSAVASPIFGFCIDRTGRNVFWVLAGTLVTLGCHSLLAFTFLNPYVAMVLMGLAYSVLASALWPMVSMVVPEQQLGTAYGLMQSFQNLGLAVISLASGKLVDSSGYLVLIVFYLVCLCVCLIACVILYLVDAARGGVLNRSAAERNLALAQDNLCKEVDKSDSLNGDT